jgi:ribokinase
VIVVVVGYASVDRTLTLDRLPAPGVTSRVLSAVGGGASGPGGIGHTALALAGAVDGDVVPICAVGDDSAGRAVTEALAGVGCRIDGIVTAEGRSPTTELLHDPAGATACLFDPGVQWADLTERQRRLIAAADVVVVMIGPAAVTRASLAHARDDATIAWIVKNDPAALPPDVVEVLRRRAAIIFHNLAESTVVTPIPAGCSPTIVRTDGPRPVTVTTDGEAHAYAIAPCPVVGNPTGAGDAFAGGFLAAWLRCADEASCVAAGAAAARLRMEAAP